MNEQQHEQARAEISGLVAQGFLAGFEQLASASALSADPADKLVLATAASRLAERAAEVVGGLRSAGVDPGRAMAPGLTPVAAFTEHTTPRSRLEALAKAVVVGGLVTDLAATLDGELAGLREQLSGPVGEVVGAVEPLFASALAAEPELADRCALYARRLLGELLSQAQRVFSSRPGVGALVTGRDGDSNDDLVGVGELMTALTRSHADRLVRLGLSSH